MPKSKTLNRVRRAQRSGRLGLALETPQHDGAPPLRRAGAEHLGANQLDRGVAREQPVLRPPDLAHAAVAEQLDQLVAAEILRLAQPASEPLQHVRRHHRHDRADVVGKEQDERPMTADGDGRRRAGVGEPDAERIHRGGDERRRQHLPRRRSARSSKTQDDDRSPRDARRVDDDRRRRPGIEHGDPERRSGSCSRDPPCVFVSDECAARTGRRANIADDNAMATDLDGQCHDSSAGTTAVTAAGGRRSVHDEAKRPEPGRQRR